MSLGSGQLATFQLAGGVAQSSATVPTIPIVVALLHSELAASLVIPVLSAGLKKQPTAATLHDRSTTAHLADNSGHATLVDPSIDVILEGG